MGETAAPQGDPQGGGEQPAPVQKPDAPVQQPAPAPVQKPAPEPSQKPSPAPAHPDDVGAGIAAFIAALGSVDAGPPTGPAPDPKVSVAFALGWQMTELYRLHEWGESPPVDTGQPPT